MMSDIPQSYSFADFKNAFSYGARNDLSFKFLKSLSDEQAAQFFQELLWKLGETYDDGDVSRLVQHGIEWQVRGYDMKGRWTYDEGPFTPLAKSPAESRLLLLASSGHFVAGDDPEPFGVKDMTQEEAVMRIGDFLQSAPTLSTIPVNTAPDQLRVRHGGYDIRGAQADPNVILPNERLLELEKEGAIGELAPEAYSFVGAAAQTPLLRRTGPQWVSLFLEQQIDAALLVPA
jgi:hypothetical protein